MKVTNYIARTKCSLELPISVVLIFISFTISPAFAQKQKPPSSREVFQRLKKAAQETVNKEITNRKAYPGDMRRWVIRWFPYYEADKQSKSLDYLSCFVNEHRLGLDSTPYELPLEMEICVVAYRKGFAKAPAKLWKENINRVEKIVYLMIIDIQSITNEQVLKQKLNERKQEIDASLEQMLAAIEAYAIAEGYRIVLHSISTYTPSIFRFIFNSLFALSGPTPELTGRAHNTATANSTIKILLTRAPVE